jgi:hypothetical protein
MRTTVRRVALRAIFTLLALVGAIGLTCVVYLPRPDTTLRELSIASSAAAPPTSYRRRPARQRAR